jgi:hypothetical protein
MSGRLMTLDDPKMPRSGPDAAGHFGFVDLRVHCAIDAGHFILAGSHLPKSEATLETTHDPAVRNGLSRRAKRSGVKRLRPVIEVKPGLR